jgi:hypothetical protein
MKEIMSDLTFQEMFQNRKHFLLYCKYMLMLYSMYVWMKYFTTVGLTVSLIATIPAMLNKFHDGAGENFEFLAEIIEIIVF